MAEGELVGQSGEFKGDGLHNASGGGSCLIPAYAIDQRDYEAVGSILEMVQLW